MAETWWRDIEFLQEPSDMGVDPAERRLMLGFNILVAKRYSRTFALELGRLLEAGDEAGPVGVMNVSIFASSVSSIPAGPGPYLMITETGGTSPERTHNSVVRPAYQRPGAQLKVHASTYHAAHGMIWHAYEVLVGVRNKRVTAQ